MKSDKSIIYGESSCYEPSTQFSTFTFLTRATSRTLVIGPRG